MKLRPRSPWSGFHDAGRTSPVALTWESSGCAGDVHEADTDLHGHVPCDRWSAADRHRLLKEGRSGLVDV